MASIAQTESVTKGRRAVIDRSRVKSRPWWATVIVFIRPYPGPGGT